MGMSASQARLLSLTARLSDLEYQAQVISNSKIRLADEGAQASTDYENALDMQVLKVENGSDGSYQDASVMNVATYGGTDLNGTNSKFRYITDTAGNLVMTASQAKSLGLTVTQAADGTYSSTFNNPDTTPKYPTVNDFIAYETAQGNIGYTTTTTTAPAAAGQQNSPATPNATGVITTITVTPANGTTAATATTTTQTPNAQAFQYYSQLYEQLSNEDKNGNSKPKVTILTDTQASDPEWLQNQITSGNVYLSEFAPNDSEFENVSWTSGDNSMNEQTDSTQMAQAEAKYDATMADINSKDKRFDAELKEIDTEHEAIQTEIDSVKKVIDKNIERSFKIFQA